MCWKSGAAAFVVTVGFAIPAAQAVPRWAGPLGGTSIITVEGCHQGERTHFVPEVGRSLPHVHLGDDCEPYRLSDSDSDDDDDADDDSPNDDDADNDSDDDDDGGY